MKKQLDTPIKYQQQYELLLDKYNLMLWRVGTAQLDIAAEFKIKSNALSRMLQDNQNMPIEIIKGMADILNLPWPSLSPNMGRDAFIKAYGENKPGDMAQLDYDLYRKIMLNIKVNMLITQKELSEALDIRQASVSRMLNGEQVVSTKMILQVIDTVGMAWERLID